MSTTTQAPKTLDPSASLHAETLGLKTIGQVLSHLQQQDRLVINVLIDGQEPDLNQLGNIKQSTITGRTVCDGCSMAWSSEPMPSGRSPPKPNTWRIENASAAAFMARSAWLTPSILVEVTIARALVRFSAATSSACRHSIGKTATTRPAR